MSGKEVIQEHKRKFKHTTWKIQTPPLYAKGNVGTTWDYKSFYCFSLFFPSRRCWNIFPTIKTACYTRVCKKDEWVFFGCFVL